MNVVNLAPIYGICYQKRESEGAVFSPLMDWPILCSDQTCSAPVVTNEGEPATNRKKVA